MLAFSASVSATTAVALTFTPSNATPAFVPSTETATSVWKLTVPFLNLSVALLPTVKASSAVYVRVFPLRSKQTLFAKSIDSLSVRLLESLMFGTLNSVASLTTSLTDSAS